MKAEDLMIGDWYYWEAEGKMYPYQVTAEDFVKGEISNFQPILLTFEILEKNGFSKQFVHDYLNNKLEEDCLAYTIEDDVLYKYLFGVVKNNGDNSNLDWEFGIWKCKDETTFFGEFLEEHIFDYITIKEIRYVHELQHALKLCKIEKEIIL